MAPKYQCPKCGRRFAEWGAEKLGFKCPQDDLCAPGAEAETIELVRVGMASVEAAPAKQTLKRKPKKTAAAAPPPADVDPFDEPDSDASAYADDTDTGDDEETVADDDLPEEVGVARRTPIVTTDDDDDDDDEAAAGNDEEEVEDLDFENESAPPEPLESFEEER